jgi:hypothetical protein
MTGSMPPWGSLVELLGSMSIVWSNNKKRTASRGSLEGEKRKVIIML